jgi:putative ABC transport system substrate-binding protein
MVVAEAQQTKKVFRIGFVSAGSPPGSIRIEPFLQGLRELGWVEGKNIAIEQRWAEGKPGRTRLLRLSWCGLRSMFSC